MDKRIQELCSLLEMGYGGRLAREALRMAIDSLPVAEAMAEALAAALPEMPPGRASEAEDLLRRWKLALEPKV